MLLPLAAQIYSVDSYTTADNLVQSQVMALMQDQKGYLWFGTHRGACRYDGQRFVALPKDSLAGNFLTAIAEDPGSGKLFFATQSGLSSFDGYRHALPLGPDSLLRLPVTAMVPAQDGTLWLGTSSHGLLQVVPGLRDTIRVPSISQSLLLRQDLKIQDLATGPRGELWVATSQGLFVGDGQQVKSWQEATLGRQDIRCLYWSGRSGRLFIGTNEGAYLWNGSALLPLFLRGSRSGSDQSVYCFTEDRQGQVWMGTGNGLRYLDTEGSLQVLRKNDNSLNFRMVSALTDREGNIWFGTDGGGARKISPGVFQAYTMEERLSSNQAKSFLRDENDQIWMSTRDRGINVLQPDGDDYSLAQVFNSENSKLGGDDICFSYEDRRGRFWFASYNGSLSRWDPDRRDFVVYGKEEGLECGDVYVVNETKDAMWIGTDNGVFRMEEDRIVGRMSTADGLPSNVVYSFLQDPIDGSLWAGTSKSLARLRPNGRFEPFAADSTVIGPTVISLAADTRGRIWVGSAVGLAWIRGREVNRVHISNTDGAHTIIGLATERDRFLWIATENGVYRLDLAQLDQPARSPVFEHFTQKDGLPSMECNANALFVDRFSGNIWVGTAEGAIRKRQGQARVQDSLPPLVYITGVKIENQTNGWQNSGFNLDSNGLPKNLELPFTQNRIEFTWIGISLRSPQQVEYQFYLEGLDKGWPAQGTRQTTFSYPNLDPGTYTFHLRSKKEEEPWDKASVTSFRFTILPPYYQSWWFVSLVVLGLGAITWGSIRVITQRRRQREEEQKIRDTAEKLQLEHQALYAMMNPHFTFNALNAIKLFIHRQDRKAADKFLSSFAKLVRMNLESTKSDFISLEEELQRLELFMELAKVRFPEKLEVFRIRVAPEVEVYDTRIPPMLLQPFVENSIEHGIKPLASGGVIEVLVDRLDDDYLQVVIRDNGIGIEASKAARADRPKDHVSRGMEITKDRLKLFARMTGKRYSLEFKDLRNADNSAAGTEVEMILPISYGKGLKK